MKGIYYQKIISMKILLSLKFLHSIMENIAELFTADHLKKKKKSFKLEINFL